MTHPSEDEYNGQDYGYRIFSATAYGPRNAPLTTARVSMVLAAGMHHPDVRILARAAISTTTKSFRALAENSTRFQWPSGSFRSENLMRAAQRKIPLVADVK